MNATEFHSSISDDFSKKYNTNLDFIERKQIWFKYLNIYLNYDERTMDAGCGSGLFSFFISENKRHSVVAVDGAIKMIELCKRRQTEEKTGNSILFYSGYIDSEEILKYGKFDNIISSSVLEYVENINLVMSYFSEIIKEDGKLFISLPNYDSLYRKVEKMIYSIFKKPKYYKYVKNVFTLNDFEEYSKNYSFFIIDKCYYGGNNKLLKKLRLYVSNRYFSNLFLIVLQKRS